MDRSPLPNSGNSLELLLCPAWNAGRCRVDFIAMGRQAGKMVAQIMKETSPGDIPIEEAERYALVFNLRRARELGMEIPIDILMAADVVYK